MATRVRDLTRNWGRDDGAKLARFWNECGRGWPGGGWDPKTEEEVRGRFRDQRLLGLFVAEVGGEIVAFCNLAAKPNERNRAYVPMLSAHPDYQGQGFGKAVLLRAVERVHELGIARVDLHTWPGNLKAVPLYKKSGFMWAPDNPWGVLMQNFTPGARRHPLAQEFFRKHHWYRAMKRDLSLTADDHKRGQVRVYPYLWEEDGDRLRMVYDRQSWGLLEIETNDFLVGCHLEDEKLVAGLSHRVRWEIVNHGGEPLEIALVAFGDEGIRLDYNRILRVRRRAELSTEFEVDPEMRDKEREPRAAIIGSDVIVNGAPLRLEAGFETKQAVGFWLDGVGQLLRPGQAERVIVQGFSELARPAQVKLRLRGEAGVTVEPAQRQVSLPARGSTELPVTLIAANSGPVQIKVESEVSVQGRTIRPKSADLNLHFGHPGEIWGHVDKHSVVLESALLRLHISRVGGWCGIADKMRNLDQAASLVSPQLGPPFAWEDFFETPCEARLERSGDRLTAVLTTPSVHRSGLWLERRITLSNLPLVEISDTIINGSTGRFQGQLKRGAQLGGDWITVMTPRGLVRSLRGGAGRVSPEHQLAKEAEAWPETWVAVEGEPGFTAGLLWGPAHRVHQHGGWNELDHLLPPVEPGQSATAPPIYLFAGEGDDFTVRRWWQNLFGPRLYRAPERPEARPPFDFGLRPDPLVVHGRQARAKLVVDSIGRLEFGGSLRVSAPDGIGITPNRAEFTKVKEDRAFSRSVALSRRSSLAEGGYFVTCAAEIDRIIYRERNTVIALGDPAASVAVTRTGERGELHRVDNGLLALTVAPEFQGSAISLERGGEQLLRSAYPEARPLAWMNPWFGGIEPFLGCVGRDLFQEKFTARTITRRGSQGITWQGVRVRCAPKQERGRKEALQVDYLLAPGSSILAVAIRTTRRAGTAGWIQAGIALWPVLGGSHLDAVISSADDPRASRLRCDFEGGLGSRRWVIAETRKSGQGVLLAASPSPVRANWVGGQVFGADGYALQASRAAMVEAGQTAESVYFLCFADGERARDLAEGLSKLKELP